MNLIVREKKVGDVIAKIVMLPEGIEIIPMKQVAELLGCGISNVKNHLGNKDTASDFIQLVKKYRQELAEHGIVSIGRGRPDRLVTKEEFEFLVKKINTPEAWGIYAELWSRAEALESFKMFQAEVRREFEWFESKVDRLGEEVRALHTRVKANTANLTMMDRRIASAEEVIALIESELGIVLTKPTKEIVKQTASFVGKSTQKFVAMLKGIRESKKLYGQGIKGNKAIVEFCKDIHNE